MIRLIGQGGEVPLHDERVSDLDGVIYTGCFHPGRDFEAMLDARQKGGFRGFVGLFITEESVVTLDSETRAKIGALMQGVPCFVADPLSVEWALHFGLHAELGGLPCWLLSQANYDGDIAQFRHLDPIMHEILRINNSCEQLPWLVQGGSAAAGGSMWAGRPQTYHPLVRMASYYGVESLLVWSEEEYEKRRVARDCVFPKEIALREQQRAIETLRRVCPPQKTTTQVLDDLLGGDVNGPREMKVGDVFDPATHYTAHYYDGRGIIYTRPDGSKETYHGTALTWEGNHTVVQLLDSVIPQDVPRQVLDVGCSSGDFVHKALLAGWDARGVDISGEAVDRAHPEVQDRLIVADVTRPTDELKNAGPFSIVTAWDFWEHIFEPDIDGLIEGVHALMKPGALGWWIICTRGLQENDHTIERGQRVSQELSWLMVSGHVTIRRWGWWAQKFAKHGFRIRHDQHALFQVGRTEHPGFKASLSWSPRNLLVVEKT